MMEISNRSKGRMKLFLTAAEARTLITEDLLCSLRPFGIRKKFYSVERLLRIAAHAAVPLNSTQILALNISNESSFFELLCINDNPDPDELLKAFLLAKRSYARSCAVVRVTELAQLLNCSLQSVYDWERAGLIPSRYSKHGWRVADILAFVESAGERKRYAKK